MGRISIAGLLGFVVVIALGLAAIISGSDLWTGAALLVTLVALLGSVIGTILRGWRGGGWLGFAVFGWGYFLLLLMPGLGDQIRWLSDFPVTWVFERANPLSGVSSWGFIQPHMPPSNYLAQPNLIPPPDLDPANGMPLPPNPPLESHFLRHAKARTIGHWLANLTFAGLGSILGVLLARGRSARLVDSQSPR